MTCYAAYDDQAPTYYCTRERGHDGWHAAHDDDTGDLYAEWPQERAFYHGRPVVIRGNGASSQAGLATFRTHRADGTRIWLCPRPGCGHRLDHGYTRGEGWEMCTNPACDYQVGLD